MTARLDAALAELAAAVRAEIESVTRPANGPDRLMSVDEAARTLGLGRSLVYSEIAAGRLATLKVGRRRLVPGESVRRYVAERASEEAP